MYGFRFLPFISFKFIYMVALKKITIQNTV